MRRRSRLFFCIALAASLGCTSLRSQSAEDRPVPAPRARPAKPEHSALPALYSIREEFDVVYGHAGGEDLQLDLCAPKDATGPFPAVLIFHGGGWTTGTREQFRPLAAVLASQGYVAATVDYRFAPRYKFPAQIHDAKSSVRWLRANAERYQIDSERIGALGYSSGALLVLLLALTQEKDGLEGDGGNPELSSRIQAVINIAGPADLTRPEWPDTTRRSICDFLGGTREQIPGAYRAASPLVYVHRGAPPVLTIHGSGDSIVPYEQSELLHTALRKAKVSSKLTTLHGKDHGLDWSDKERQRNVKTILAFLDQNLRR